MNKEQLENWKKVTNHWQNTRRTKGLNENERKKAIEAKSKNILRQMYQIIFKRFRNDDYYKELNERY